MWQFVFASCHRLSLKKIIPKGCLMVMADPLDLGHGKKRGPSLSGKQTKLKKKLLKKGRSCGRHGLCFHNSGKTKYCFTSAELNTGTEMQKVMAVLVARSTIFFWPSVLLCSAMHLQIVQSCTVAQPSLISQFGPILRGEGSNGASFFFGLRYRENKTCSKTPNTSTFLGATLR